MKEAKIFRPSESETEQDAVGQPISPERLAQIYKGRENSAFWQFVLKLRENNWLKFCISRANFRFEKIR